MRLDVGKVLGRIASGWWVQVHDFTAEGEKSHHRGRLVATVSLFQEGVEELETVSAGREALARLQELYFGNLEGDPLSALKRSLTTLKQEFGEVEVVCLARVDKALYVVALGGGGVWVKSGSKEGWLINPNRTTGELVALSGWITAGQTLVGGNSKFWQALTVGAVRAALGNSSTVDEAAEMMGAVVHGNDSGIGGVGVVAQTFLPIKKDEATSLSPSPVSTVRQTGGGIKAKLARFVPKPSGPIFISAGDREHSRKRNMWVGIGFLLLLLLLVGRWQWRSSYLRGKTSAQNQKLDELVHKFNEAQTLVELNPARSRQLLVEVESGMEEFKASKKKDDRLSQIEANFGSVLGAATGVKQVTAQEVLDLGWLRPDMTGSHIARSETGLVVLDSQADRLIVVDPNRKSGRIIAGQSSLGQTKLVAVYPGKISVMSDKGIIECNEEGSCQTAVATDEEWRGVVDMDMFAGNIYLLSKGGIWRYQATESGYGTRQQWLAQTEDAALLNTSLNMAIDAHVWAMQANGQILKYTRGVREDFSPLDLDKPFMAGAIIYADSEAEKLYILDRGQGRVVVLAKTGEYLLQYQLNAALEAVDLAVDEAEGRLYLLAGSKIWGVDL